MDIFKDEKAETASLIHFIYRERKKLLLGLAMGLLLGLGFYFLTPQKFRAFGIIYPANPNTRDMIISNPQFGHEIEAERLMQLLESRSLRDSVVHKFQLMAYYEIDQRKKDWQERLNRGFIKDIRFERSKYLSIVVSAELKDPDLAADVVNYIIEVVNDYRKRIYSENIQNELTYLKDKRDKQEGKWKAIRDKIYSVKDSNNIDNIIENFLIKNAKEQFFEPEFINSVQITEWLEEYKLQKHKFMDYDIEYQKAVEMSNRPVLKNYVVDKAIPSYKPVSPSFIKVVLLASLVGFFVAFLFIWVFDIWKNVKRDFEQTNAK